MGETKSTKERFMRQAIALAEEAATEGNAPFGAVIVNTSTGEIACQGSNHADQNSIWHGEMDAINDLSSVAEKNGISVYEYCKRNKLELYTTAEPCAMCMGCVLFTGISNVVYGTSIDKLKEFGWNQITISCVELARMSWMEVKVEAGLLEELTNQLYAKGPYAEAPTRNHDTLIFKK